MDMDDDQLEVITKLEELKDAQYRGMELIGADLRDRDLSGIKLNFVNLSYAKLEKVNLTNAQLNNVILTGAQLQGARIQGAEFYYIEATGANLSEAEASGSHWEHSNLLSVEFKGANLTEARFRYCTLDEASFKDVTISGGGIIHSTCDGANFKQARLTNLETIGSSFQRADLTEAEQFLSCREIIVEILRRHIDKEIEQTKLVGAALLMRYWCYADWKKYLTTPDMKSYYALALDILEMYPESGAYKALQEGWDWRHMSGQAKKDDMQDS